MKNSEQLARANRLVGYHKEDHPLLVELNEKEVGITLERFIGEVEELLEEFHHWQLASDEAGRLLRPNGKFWGEYFDVITLLKAVASSQEKGLENSLVAINRIATEVSKPFQGDIKQLLETAGNIMEGDFYQNMEDFLQRMYALAIYTGETDVFVAYAWLHQKKDWQNRPSSLFQETYENFDHDVQAEAHLCKGLRLLRNEARAHTGMEVSLPPWLAAQFRQDLLDWRNSELALARMKSRLESQDWLLQIHAEVEEELRENFNPEPSNELIEKLLIAGAVPVNFSKQEEHALNQQFLDPQEEYQPSLLAKS